MSSEITDLFGQIKEFSAQPLDQWHPSKAVDIDIRIDSSGQWHYQGSSINRHAIVKLFSTVLRKEGTEYFLVTPPVKYRIVVEDAPFLAVELQIKNPGENQSILFRTNMDNVVALDHHHKIEMRTGQHADYAMPYIEVRDGLWAKLTRPVFYELAELASNEGNAEGNDFIVKSAGYSFPLETA